MEDKKRWIILLLTVMSLGVAVIGSRLSSGTATHITDFKLIPFYLNYQEMGFIRRGFVGSFVHLFNLQNPEAIITIAYAQIAIAAVAFWSWVISYQKNINQIAWYYAICLLSPALFLHFGFDLGRPDSLNLAVLILALYLTSKNYYLLAAIAASTGILIHEVFLFSSLPIILVLAYYQSRLLPEKIVVMRIVMLAFFPILTNVLLLALAGENVDVVKASATLEKYMDPQGAQYYYLKFTSIKYNTITSLLNFYGSLLLNIYQLGVLVIYLVIFYMCLVKFVSFKKDKNEKLLIKTCFSPLLIMVFAVDKGRWFSMIISNLLLIFPYLQMQAPKEKNQFNLGICLTVILTGLILGPITVSSFHFASIFDWVFVEPGHRNYPFHFRF